MSTPYGFPGLLEARAPLDYRVVRYGAPTMGQSGIGPFAPGGLTSAAVPALWNGRPSNYNANYVVPYRGASLGAFAPDFIRFARFGIVDNALLVGMMLAGVSFEDKIAKKIGASGYGPVLGAAIASAISDGVAGLSEGRSAALGVTAGALLPVLPIVVAMLAKKPLKGSTQKALLASSVALLALVFVGKRSRATA